MKIEGTVLAATLALAVATLAASQNNHQSHFDGPKPTKSVVPDYPAIALAACVQGTASIVVELNQEGRVDATDFIAGSPLFEKAVVEVSRQWLFEPAATAGRRRQVLQFSFAIVSRQAPKKAATSFFRTPTDVEVRSRWISGGGCSDCSREAEQRMQRESERRCIGERDV
jgi:TonB family protein